MTDKVIALTTCASAEEARRIAQSLVEARLAACVQIVPNVTSVYRWKGAVEESQEWLLLIKTAAGLLEDLKEQLRAIHSYETPELVALTIVDGAQPYLDWMSAELR